MTDTVTVNAPVTYIAWKAPRYAILDLPAQAGTQPGAVSGAREAPAVNVEDLAPHVLDALAKQWLDHLYASVERASPFRLDP